MLEPLGLFFPDQLSWGWKGYLGLLGLSIAWALYTARPRRAIEHALPPSDVTIAIRCGDVLAQRGNIVVGSNDVFDTEFDQDVINPNSVQGQLLSRVFNGDRGELDRQIRESLADYPSTQDPTKTFGKTTRYDIGAVAVVRQGQGRFFLTAFTKMSSTLPANVSSTMEDLQISLARTWESIAVAGQREPVHMPVVGSNYARLGFTRTLLIQIIVLSFIAAETRGKVASSLTVYVSPADLEIVDMAVLDEWLSGLCAK